jgi:hypothetical protein
VAMGFGLWYEMVTWQCCQTRISSFWLASAPCGCSGCRGGVFVSRFVDEKVCVVDTSVSCVVTNFPFYNYIIL